MAKIYSKNTWVDEVLAGDERFDIKEDGGGAFKANMQINLATAVSQAGTAANAAKMNNIENGIDALDTLLAALTTWVAYTPTWAASGGTPTLGNGSLTAKKSSIGKRMRVHVELVWGSGTSCTGSTWSFTLPAGITGVGLHIGSAYILDNLTGQYGGICRVESNVIYVLSPTAGYVTAASPMTWASGDKLIFDVEFETT